MKTLGMIAGNGRFPLLLAEEAQRNGYKTVIGAIEGEADSSLKEFSNVFSWIKVGELKKLVKFFLSEGAHEAVMAGKIEKVRFFKENVHLDFDMMKVLMKIKDFKDDSILGAIARYLHEEGIDLLDSTLFVKKMIPGAGVLSKKKPSKEVMENIEFGFRVAKQIAGADIGQTVIVKKKTVLAVEAIEGSDEAIRRGGELGRGKIIGIKVSKPNQDMRFDVPAVGLRTLEGLIKTKAEAFAFEAEKTVFLDKDLFIQKADRHGMVLFGVNAKEMGF